LPNINISIYKAPNGSGRAISTQEQYSAFISYAHADERAAKRLHEALENYDLPDGVLVNGRESFSPIFRDVTELTAAHSLSETIQQALARSSHLIVLCSPASKDSHWVNEEIRLFRSLHGDRAILSAIVDGTPSASFPPALLENGHEPLAANLKSGRDSFRFGVHQLAASILGVGLDTLVQRGERKRRIRNQFIMAGTTALAVVMSGFAWTTYSAQKAAEKSRDDAERLVEYMVSDLKSELYSLQRLDILDGLGEEIVEYYEGIDPERLPDERLVKLITAIQTLSEVANLEQSFDKSHRYLADSSRLIDVLEKRDPNSDDSLFYRAQNEFWIGQIYKVQNDFKQALTHWENYDHLGQTLYKKDPTNKKWIMEAGWGQNNLAILNRHLENYELANSQSLAAVEIFEKVYLMDVDNVFISYEFANIVSGAAISHRSLGNLEKSIELYRRIQRIYDNILGKKNDNYKARYYRNLSMSSLLELEGVSKCHSDKYASILAESRHLSTYEPENFRWRTELFFQELSRFEDCKKNFPSHYIADEIRHFIEVVKRPENEIFYAQNSERIKKLRAKDPEPIK